MRDCEVRVADITDQFELILKTIGLSNGADAAKKRVDSLVPKIESQVCLLLWIDLDLAQQNQAGVRVLRGARRFTRRRDIESLCEQWIGRVGKAAARESGVELEAVLRVAGNEAQAPAHAAFGVGQRSLAEVVERQQ